MNMPKLFLLFVLLIFGMIGVTALIKSFSPTFSPDSPLEIIVVGIDAEKQMFTPIITPQTTANSYKEIAESTADADLPHANRIEELFNKNQSTLPIVETVTYKSRVPWQKGRPAWLSDYAAHYETSRHFIARSLNGKPDYFKQEVAEGDKFNVLRTDKNIEFYLLVDTSRCRMWFYYIDHELKQKVLLKTYSIGLGRLDGTKPSGLLTPLGGYQLGDRIAIYKPKMRGIHQGKTIEMVTVFGTRWIPFEKEIGVCTAPAKGFGIHGTPWTPSFNGEFIDNTASICKYESDGCIRLATPDMEELFAIIITKPTTIEIVPHMRASSLFKDFTYKE
jgi:hypothetical protein